MDKLFKDVQLEQLHNDLELVREMLNIPQLIYISNAFSSRALRRVSLKLEPF